MNIVLLLIKQLITMSLYMVIGIILFKKKIITELESTELAKLLLWLIIPAVIIKSFCVEPTQNRVSALIISTVASVIALALSIVCSYLFFKKQEINFFAASFANAGFIGIPLVQATLGSECVFYITALIVLLNILQWFFSYYLFAEKAIKSKTSIIRNPIIISVIIGLILFFTGTGYRMPDAFTSILNGLGDLNTPLAMLVLGIYFAQSDIRSIWKNTGLYKLSAVRLLIIPLITLLCLQIIIPSDNINIKLAILISASAPVGSNVAMYSKLYNKDYIYASNTVVFTTIFSILSLPLILFLANH